MTKVTDNDPAAEDGNLDPQAAPQDNNPPVETPVEPTGDPSITDQAEPTHPDLSANPDAEAVETAPDTFEQDSEEAAETHETPEEGEVEHPEWDANNKVMLSGAAMDGIDKDELRGIIGRSQILGYHKDKINQQIDAGQISDAYSRSVRSIIEADKSGSVYRPGQDGI